MKLNDEDISRDPMMGKFLEFLENRIIVHVQNSFLKKYTINGIYRSIERQSLATQKLQQFPHNHNTNETNKHIPPDNNFSGTCT